MIIARFGDTWSGAYEFAETRGEDNWNTARPAIIQQVGGATGAYDFFGDDNFPIAPLQIIKKFELTASTYIGIDTALETLQGDTIAVGRSKLWMELRNATRRWAWAKCIKLKANEVYGRQYLNMPIELEFICPEGIWYSEATNNVQIVGSGNNLITNSGNIDAPIRITITSGGTDPTLTVTNGGTWTWTGTTSGTGLVVDAASYECTNNGVGAYDTLTVGSGQMLWLKLPPGQEQLTISVTGSPTMTATWYDCYAL